MLRDGARPLYVLGLAASHNAAVSITKDGRVVAAIQLERLSRKKRHGFSLDQICLTTIEAIHYCLAVAGISLKEIGAVATCTPWEVTDLALPETLSLLRPVPVISVPHHLAHAEYALHYFAGDRCIVLVCDGSGTREDLRSQLGIKEKESNPVKFVHPSGKESISAYAYDGQDLSLIYRFAAETPSFRELNELNYFSHPERFVTSLGVIDARRELPFPDATFSFIFSEHMIEHISFPEGKNFLSECHRVLKPGGKVRIVTPDFKFLFNLYAHPRFAIARPLPSVGNRNFPSPRHTGGGHTCNE